MAVIPKEREAEVSFVHAMKIATKIMAVYITNNFT